MAENEKPKLFDFIEKFDIRTLTEVPIDLICSICGKAMINSCFSPCFCQYCEKCIRDHLESKTEKICPGNTKRCKLVELDLNENVHIDERINLKIFMLEIKCPTESCTYQDCVYNMMDHLKTCDGTSNYCPYSIVGCDSTNTTHPNFSRHAFLEDKQHVGILMSFVGDMEKQIGALQEKQNNSSINVALNMKSSFEEMTKNIETNQIIIEELKKNIEAIFEMQQNIQERVDSNRSRILDVKNSTENFVGPKQSLNKRLEKQGESSPKKSTTEFVKINEFAKWKKEFEIDGSTQMYCWSDLMESPKESLSWLDTRMDILNDFRCGFDMKQADLKEEIKSAETAMGNVVQHFKEIKKNVNVFQAELSKLVGEVKNSYENITSCLQLLDIQSRKLAETEKELAKQTGNKDEILDLTRRLNKMKAVQAECLTKMADVKQLEGKVEKMYQRQMKYCEMLEKMQTDAMIIRAKLPGPFEMHHAPDEAPFQSLGLPTNEFVWKIEKLSQKRKDAKMGVNVDIMSEPFYSHENGYKMCLWLSPNSKKKFKGTHIFLGFTILQGEFDDFLEWPCRCTIRISVIRQDDKTEDFIKIYSYDECYENYRYRYDRPTSTFNREEGHPSYLSWHGLKKNSEIYQNDTIYVRCKIFSYL